MKFSVSFLIKVLKTKIAATLRLIKSGIKRYVEQLLNLEDELESLEARQVTPVPAPTQKPFTRNVLINLSQLQKLRLIYRIKEAAEIESEITLISAKREESGHCTREYKDLLIIEYHEWVNGKKQDRKTIVLENASRFITNLNKDDFDSDEDIAIMNLIISKIKVRGFGGAKIIKRPHYYGNTEIINCNPRNYYLDEPCCYIGLTSNSFWMSFAIGVEQIEKYQYFSQLHDLINAILFQGGGAVI